MNSVLLGRRRGAFSKNGSSGLFTNRSGPKCACGLDVDFRAPDARCLLCQQISRTDEALVKVATKGVDQRFYLFISRRGANIIEVGFVDGFWEEVPTGTQRHATTHYQDIDDQYTRRCIDEGWEPVNWIFTRPTAT